jgi:CDP-diacylglycerol--serine O-phosphatidyltransferase
LGAIAVVFALKGFFETAVVLIICAAVFDFLDGFLARLLKVQSPLGEDLDSLSDIVSFGVAPAAILFVWMSFCFTNLPQELQVFPLTLLPYFAFIIVPFSAFRLGKFNNDTRQQYYFYGLPTPANAFFIAFLPFAADHLPFLDNFWVLMGITLVFSLLLVIEFPMFSLKFSTFSFKKNWVRYLFLFLSAILLIAFQLAAFPFIILLYILISLLLLGLAKVIHQ